MKIKNISFINKLERVGFTDKEAVVYVSVLELGGAFPSRVAEYSGLNRSTTYKILLSLSIRGIINEIEKKNKIFYQIDKPEKVLRYVENKTKQFEDSVEEIKKILPEIEGVYNAGQNRPKITYLNGVENILSVYNDMVSYKKPYEMLAFSNANQLMDFLPVEFYSKYVKEKERIGIKTRGIIPKTEMAEKYSEIVFKDIDKKYWPEIRCVDKEMFPSPSEITIYGENKVSIINYDKNQMTGVIIEDKAIHDMMRSVFELSWIGAEK
jgi:sugar-specific transcriptional regulator TrmB